VRARVEVGGRPRVGLLYEYAPSFVSPKHRYPPRTIARHVPEAERAIFPVLDVPEVLARDEAAAIAAAAGGGAAAECADGGLDFISVWEWPAAMRARPHCARASTRIVLRGGHVAMPAFGLGTGAPDDEAAVIGAAVRAGYRLIDTGQLYANEHIVREGIRLSGVHREALFIASKAGEWCPGWYPTPRSTLARAVCIGGYERTRAAVSASLANLGVEYIDLYLLHWPMGLGAAREPPEDDERSPMRLDDPAHRDARLGAWRALVELRASGVLRAIGVANWSQRQIEEAAAATGELPQVLQMEMHPLLQRPQLRAFCERVGILVQAYGNHHENIRGHPALLQLAKSNAHLAQLVPEPVGLLAMRWSLHSGAAILPRSRKPQYIEANKRVFWAGFRQVLTPEAMEQIAQLDANTSLYGAHHLFVSDSIQ